MLMARYSHKRRIRNSRAGVSHDGMCVNMNKMCVYVFMQRNGCVYAVKKQFCGIERGQDEISRNNCFVFRSLLNLFYLIVCLVCQSLRRT
jgi:hypothetical protein